MPRLSAAQEQHVRERIIRAAVEVFAEKGYHRATIADVVARSGLSVGAIYTHFTGKEQLFLQSCDLISDQGLDELAVRLAPLTTTAGAPARRHRLLRRDDRRRSTARPARSASSAPGPRPTRSPAFARCSSVAASAWSAPAQLLLREGIARGELPSWLDVDGFARGFMALLDGLLLQRIEAGDGYRAGRVGPAGDRDPRRPAGRATAERPGVATA